MANVDVQPVIAEIVKIDVIGMRNYKGDSSICNICKNPLTFPCLECETENKDRCIVVICKCKHNFHSHCMQNWRRVQGKEFCPTCNVVVNYEVKNADDPDLFKAIKNKKKKESV